jgi:GNAT superfamily N-acetyltransferase
VLADGRTARIRAVRPDDDGRVLGLYGRLSPDSMYLRFFSPLPPERARQVEHLTQVDHEAHVVIVAEVGDELMAMARYDRLGSDRAAEVAFVVDDAEQGHGLGTLLLEHLAAIGRSHGIERFVATTLAQNWKMLAVFQDAGYEVTSHFVEGVIEVSFPIEPSEASLAAQQAREHESEAGRSPSCSRRARSR